MKRYIAKLNICLSTYFAVIGDFLGTGAGPIGLSRVTNVRGLPAKSRHRRPKTSTVG
jgi:hypothetical protein